MNNIEAGDYVFTVEAEGYEIETVNVKIEDGTVAIGELSYKTLQHLFADTLYCFFLWSVVGSLLIRIQLLVERMNGNALLLPEPHEAIVEADA